MSSVNEPDSTWRIRTAGGIAYRPRKMTGSVGLEDATVTQEVVMRSTNLLAFIEEAMPTPYEVLGGVFYPPRAYLLGFPSLRVNRISWESLTDKPIDPFDADSGAPAGTYDRDIVVTLEFGTVPSNDQSPEQTDPETFLEISVDASGTFLTSTVRGQATWIGHGGAPNEEVMTPVFQTVTEPESEWNLRWNQIPFAWFRDTMIARMRGRLGTVNSSAMVVCGNAPAETILFLGYSLRRQYTWRQGYRGLSPVSLDLKFLEKNFITPENVQVTHNHMWRDGVGYRRMIVNGNPLYGQTNLNDLFGS